MIPAMYVGFRGETSHDLWWTTSSNGTTFDAAARTAAQLNKTPGVAVYKDKMYAVYQGEDSKNFFWMTSSDGKIWTQKEMPSYQLAGGAALAVYKDKLYAAYAGKDSKNFFWAILNDDENGWTQYGNSNIQFHYTPSMAVFNGVLYIAYAGLDSDKFFWAMTTDGQRWTQREMPWTMSDGPGLAVFKNKLYAAFRGSSSHDLYLAYTEDGQTWTMQSQSPINVGSSISLAVFDQRLYAFFKSDGDDNCFCYATTTDGTNWEQHVDTSMRMSGGPGAAVSGLSIASLTVPEDLDQEDVTIFGGTVGSDSLRYYTDYGTTLSGHFSFPYDQTWFASVDTLGVVSLTFSPRDSTDGCYVIINGSTENRLDCLESDSLRLSFSDDGTVTVSSSKGVQTVMAGADLAAAVPSIQTMYNMVAGSPTLQAKWNESAIDTLYDMGLPRGVLSNLDWQSDWYEGGTTPCSVQFANALQALTFPSPAAGVEGEAVSATLGCMACKALTIGAASAIFAVCVILVTNPNANSKEALEEAVEAYKPSRQLANYCGVTLGVFAGVVAKQFLEAAASNFVDNCAEALCEAMGAC